MELISKLGIDLKLLLAQLINFGILVLILYKFVYRPVLQMLHDRQAKIEQGLNDAKKGEALLKQIEEIQEKRRKETEHEVGMMLAAAAKDAQRMKEEIAEEARSQADELLKRVKAQTEEIKHGILDEVKRESVAIMLRALEKILEREFSAEDQKRLEQAISNEMLAAEPPSTH